MNYKLQNQYFAGQFAGTSVMRISDHGITTSIPFDPMNSDYQEFLRWCEAGNEPLPPDSQE